MTACGKEKKTEKKEDSAAEQQKDSKDSKEKDSKEKDSKAEKVTAERGVFNGDVYTNKSMGIQVTFPEGCTMYSDEEIQQVVGAGSDMMEKTYDSERVEKSISGTIYDVIAVTSDQGANIQILMEDTANIKEGGLSAQEYAQVTKESLKKTYENAGVVVEEVKVLEESLGGMEFSKVSISLNGMIQEYYIHQVENYAFVFTMTYSEAAAATVQQFLDSVTAI